jgi:hypothetical protein
MKTDIPPPSASRRLLACCGFAVCWLAAAITGMQATVGERPGRVLRVEQRGAGPGQARPELATQSADSQRADPAFERRTAIREFWR